MEKEDSFSVKVKIETATKAVKKPVQRQTALCGLILSASEGDLLSPVREVKIPDRLSELVLQLFEAEGITCSYSKGKITVENLESSALWSRCLELVNSIENNSLSVEEARRLLRGAFWGTGYCSEPKKRYRIEFLVPDEKTTVVITVALDTLSIKYVKSKRENAYSVYFKNGDDVSDFLGYIGSPAAMMDFENVRAEKEVKSQVRRAVNCDAGNSKRQAEAAATRSELINKVIESGKINKLAPELREAAIAHMENPGASIAELGAMMDPPIGKSGMRHRLDKIAEFAKTLK